MDIPGRGDGQRRSAWEGPTDGPPARSSVNRRRSLGGGRNSLASAASPQPEMDLSVLSELGSSAGILLGDPTAVQLPDRKWFLAAVGLSTLLNMVFLGIEVNVSCWDCAPEDRLGWTALDLIFTVVFSTEMAIRTSSVGLGAWLRGTSEPYINVASAVLNVGDLILVLLRSSWILAFAGVTQLPKLLSAMRVVHLGKTIRAVPNSEKFRELWLFLQGLGNVAQTVSWVVVLLLLLTYVFAVLMTILVGKSDEAYDYSMGRWSKEDYWGSVPQSMLTLFQVLTWDHWFSKVARPLVQRHPVFMIVFIPFLCVGTLGLMNIIIAVIIEGVMNAAELNAEREAKEKQKLDRIVMDSLKAIFEEADTDGSGELDMGELSQAVTHRSVRERLDLLGIGVSDLNLLFGLLDENGSGQISTGRFFRGCLRLRGVAMATDLNRLNTDATRSINRAKQLVNQVDTMNNSLVEVIKKLSAADVEVVRGEGDEFDEVLKARRDRPNLMKEANHKVDVRHESILLRLGLDDPDLQDLLDVRSPSRNKSLVHAALRNSALAIEDLDKPHTPLSRPPGFDGPSRRTSASMSPMKKKPTRPISSEGHGRRLSLLLS